MKKEIKSEVFWVGLKKSRKEWKRWKEKN